MTKLEKLKRLQAVCQDDKIDDILVTLTEKQLDEVAKQLFNQRTELIMLKQILPYDDYNLLLKHRMTIILKNIQ